MIGHRGGHGDATERSAVAVFSGMLGVTMFGIFLTPVFFFVIEWLSQLVAVRLDGGPSIRSAVLLMDILTLGFLWTAVALRRARRRIRCSSGRADSSWMQELADVDRFFDRAIEARKRPRRISGTRQPASEKMVVVDHQRGKTDIIVVQQTVVAAAANGHEASEEVAAAPLVADLAKQSGNGHAASLPERREEHK